MNIRFLYQDNPTGSLYFLQGDTLCQVAQLDSSGVIDLQEDGCEVDFDRGDFSNIPIANVRDIETILLRKSYNALLPLDDDDDGHAAAEHATGVQ